MADDDRDVDDLAFGADLGLAFDAAGDLRLDADLDSTVFCLFPAATDALSLADTAPFFCNSSSDGTHNFLSKLSRRC